MHLLQQDLESLNGTLKLLDEVMDEDSADFASISFPLKQCSKACQDLRGLISKCTAHSNTERISFRDAAQFLIKEADINDVRTRISHYKSTLMVAIGCINY